MHGLCVLDLCQVGFKFGLVRGMPEQLLLFYKRCFEPMLNELNKPRSDSLDEGPKTFVFL